MKAINVASRRVLLSAVLGPLTLPPRPGLAAPVGGLVSNARVGGLISNARGFYSAWNRKDVDTAMSFFSPSITFYDAQYAKPFVGAAQVRAYLQECADSLPGWQFIIDDYAEDLERGRLGLRWHVEDSSELPLPFPSNGLSFLEFGPDGYIAVCRDMVEPTLKTGAFQLPLLRAVSKILGVQ